MSLFSEESVSAFQGAGAKPGVEIWCVDNLRLVRVPKSLHGKFYSGNAYLVLITVFAKSGPPQYDIHYWIGKDAKEVESAFASDKALELDDALGSCTVQYREIQGEETEKFLSYFKPCIIPVEGIDSPQSGPSHGEAHKISLFTCKGDHVVSVKEVPFARSSLNHNDVFILDTASKIFLFSGCNSSIQERAKALDVVQHIRDSKHGGNCEVVTIEDGKFIGDPDVGEFWSLFGGYAPIPRDSPCSSHKESNNPSVQLYWITAQETLCPTGSRSLNKDMLESNKCYMLDVGSDIFVWMGSSTSVTERKKSISIVEDFLGRHVRSNASHLTLLTEGLETSTFKSYFQDWPQVMETKLYKEGRGKVAAIFKQHGYDVKELPDEEDCHPHIDCSGKLKVWRVNGDELSLVPVPEQRKLFSGDCYIAQYMYPGDGRDENLFYAWLGRESVLEDRIDAISHMNAIVETTKGNTVLAQIIQDKEPMLFFLIFQTVIIFKGGSCKRYHNSMSERCIQCGTYDDKRIALFRVQGTSPENVQALQVDQVSTSLNSSYCFILQTGTSTFTWMGSLTSSKDHDLLDKMLELIDPTCQPTSVREGSEPDSFWTALGGKAEYSREKLVKRHIEDLHLFAVMSTDGDLKVKEIYNFTQDDLTTEDVLILDGHEEIYVWIGHHSKIKSKKQAFALGQKFLQKDSLGEGLSLGMPIYIVTEGQEPSFFTDFFEWDSSKANMHGNSFERKLTILKGNKQNLEIPVRNSWKASRWDSTPESLIKSIGSNGRGSSLFSSSIFPGPNSNSPNNPLSNSTPIMRKLFIGSPLQGSPTSGESSPSQHSNSAETNSTDAGISRLTYPYERLKVGSREPVTDIEVTKREAYLCDEEFQEKFGMTKGAFYVLPKWKQNKLKMSVNLF